MKILTGVYCSCKCSERVQQLQAAIDAQSSVKHQTADSEPSTDIEELTSRINHLAKEKASAEERVLTLEQMLKKAEQDASKKLDTHRKQADDAHARMEEEMASYQDQVAELQNRVQELEKVHCGTGPTAAGDTALADEAAAKENQRLVERVSELGAQLKARETELGSLKEKSKAIVQVTVIVILLSVAFVHFVLPFHQFTWA